MIIRVELHSAVSGQITKIERARIAVNIGRSETLGNYARETLRGPCAVDQRSSFIEKHPTRPSTTGIWSPELSKPWGYGE